MNHVNFLWNQYFKADLGLRVLTTIKALETNAGLSLYKTLHGSQEFYVFREGLYYTRGFTVDFIDVPTSVVDLFFLLVSSRFYIEDIMYNNYKLQRFLLETYG